MRKDENRTKALELNLPTYLPSSPCSRGHLSERRTYNHGCIECARETSAAWNKRNSEKVLSAAKKYRKSNPEKVSESRAMSRSKRRDIDREYRREWQKSHPIHHAAHNAVWRAVKTGSLVPLPCERCGCPDDIHAHHEDHRKKLDVVWLCRSCHAKRHAEIRAQCGVRV